MRKKVRTVAIILILLGFTLLGYYVWITFQSILAREVGKDIFDNLAPQIELTDNVNEALDTEQGDLAEGEDLSAYRELVPKLREAYGNEDIVAYISYPEANIDYPIVKGRTTEEYLRKDAYGKYSASGSIILDSYNASAFDDVASIIYGHCMKNTSMFGKLESHTREVGLGEQFYVYTKTERITYETIAYGVVEPEDRSSYIMPGYEGYPTFLKVLSSKAEKYELCPNNNRFITLITCTYPGVGVKKRFGVTAAEVNREPYILSGKEVVK